MTVLAVNFGVSRILKLSSYLFHCLRAEYFILFMFFSSSDPNSPDFCDIHHQGKNCQVHPQCSCCLHSGRYSHLHILDLQRCNFQINDQIMEKSNHEEQSCKHGKYRRRWRWESIILSFYKESIKMSSKPTDSSQVCFNAKETKYEL